MSEYDLKELDKKVMEKELQNYDLRKIDASLNNMLEEALQKNNPNYDMSKKEMAAEITARSKELFTVMKRALQNLQDEQ